MKILKIYDGGEEMFDRYTVVIDVRHNGLYECLGLSDNPEHPQGFSQWSDCMIGDHLGREIQLDELPMKLQEHIKWRVFEE